MVIKYSLIGTLYFLRSGPTKTLAENNKSIESFKDLRPHSHNASPDLWLYDSCGMVDIP